MYGIIIFLLLFTSLCLIVMQQLNIRIIIIDGYRIEFDYSFIKLILKSNSHKSSKTQKKHKSNAKKRRILNPILSFIKALVSRSEIVLNKLQICTSNAEPKSHAIATSIIKFALSPFLFYLSDNSKKFKVSDRAVVLCNSHDPFQPITLDLSIKTTLFGFIYSATVFSYEILKRKIEDIKK